MKKKIITTEQIKAIIDTFYDLNAPVKLYASVKDTLEKLPVMEEKTDETLDKAD